jgi:hypothetical protein
VGVAGGGMDLWLEKSLSSLSPHEIGNFDPEPLCSIIRSTLLQEPDKIEVLDYADL